MFKCQARRKNSYLHKTIDHMEPGNINRNVCRALLQPTINQFDLNPPIIINVALQPVLFGPKLDVTKAELAYGSWGIPKLIRELHSEKPYVRSRALTTLNDELRNPEALFRACKHFKLVKSLSRVLLHLISVIDENSRDNMYCIERTIINFEIAATHLEFAIQISEERFTLLALYDLIQSVDLISVQAARVIAILVCHRIVADKLVNEGHLYNMMDVLLRVNKIPEFLLAAAELIERNPLKGLKAGYMDFLVNLINVNHPSETAIIKCLAVLLETAEAQEVADSIDLVAKLIQTIRNPNSNVITLEHATMALNNCLISTRSRWRAREFWDLPLLMVTLAHNKKNKRLQMHALQTLIHIIEMPSVKEFVKRVCKNKIKNICCNSDEIFYRKQKLLFMLRSSVYRHPIERFEENEELSGVSCGDTVVELPGNRMKFFPYRLDRRPSSPDSDRSSVATDELTELIPKVSPKASKCQV